MERALENIFMTGKLLTRIISVNISAVSRSACMIISVLYTSAIFYSWH